MEPTDAIPLAGRMERPEAGSRLRVGWRLWRTLAGRWRATQRPRDVTLHVGRVALLLLLAALATLCASFASVWMQTRQLALDHAQAALQHVESRLDGVVEEMQTLARTGDAWGFEACPEMLRRDLTRASLSSLQVMRFVVVVKGEAAACFPEGPGPVPRIPLVADAFPHLVDDTGREPTLWVTLSQHERFPGAFLVVQLDRRAFADWSSASTREAGDAGIPPGAWTARLRAVSGGTLTALGNPMQAAPRDGGMAQTLWSQRYRLGVTAELAAADITASSWRRSAGAALPVLVLIGLLVGGIWRHTVHRARLNHRLQLALRKRQFEPFVQPIVDLSSGRCAGAEVLMRWRHPQRGILAPAEFIEEAERTGLIAPMSDLVMARAAHRLAAIAKSRPELYFSFNITPLQLRQPGFGARLGELFRSDTLVRERVLLELTEREFIDGETSRTLAALKAVGWRVAVDDFGTGHSSLAALEQLAIDRIKIDRAFVRTIDEGTVNRPVLDAIIALAGQLGVPLIAEGVETRSQWDYLAARGVGHAQGFLMARPMSIESFTRWLADQDGKQGPVSDADDPLASAGSTTTDAQALALWHQMRMPGGLDVRDRMYHLQTFRQCFVGREAVDWIVQRLRVTRNEAVRVGQHLVALDLIRHVRDEHDFEDAAFFFVFNQSTTELSDPTPASDDYRQALRGPTGVPMRDHARGLIRLRSCATGRAIVDWTVQRYGVSRSTACQWAAQLMRVGALHHVFDDRPFSDNRTLFQVR